MELHASSRLYMQEKSTPNAYLEIIIYHGVPLLKTTTLTKNGGIAVLNVRQI